MNYQGKNRLFMSIGLTFLLIITTIILVLAKPEARGVLLAMSIIIIAVALMGVYITYRQVLHIKTRIDNLPNDYQIVYIDIHELIGTYAINKSDKKQILGMILEIFEHASLDNRDVNEVVGNDLGQFVESFTIETGRTHNGIYLFSYSTSLFIGYLLLMKLYKVVRTGNVSTETLQSETLDIGLVGTYALISFIFFPWLMLLIQKSAKYQWRGLKRAQILFPFIIPFGLMFALILIGNPSFTNFIDQPIPIFTSLWTVGIGIILFIASLFMIKYTRSKNK